MTKFFIIKALQGRFSKYNKIHKISKVATKVIVIHFDNGSGDSAYYFDFNLVSVYKKPQEQSDDNSQVFNSPFDLFLKNKLKNTNIANVEILNNDKILCLKLVSKKSYKQDEFYLIIEFLPRVANLIVLNANHKILQALYFKQFQNRNIQISQTYQPPQKPNIEFKSDRVDDLDKLLIDNYLQINSSVLQNKKADKIKTIKSKIQALQKILHSLNNSQELKKQADELQNKASLLLANIDKIKPYTNKIELKDSDNKDIVIAIDGGANPIDVINKMFDKSKKLKVKSNKIHIQKDEIESKIEFYSKLISNIQEANNENECEFLYPTQNKSKKKQNEKNKPYASFEYDGFLIWLGRNERENIYLLKNSNASDFWFHIQGMPSCHVIVKTKKKTLPDEVVQKASMLCASFSLNKGDGTFKVDYTKRANVTIKNGANVTYKQYSSVSVNI